MRLQKWAAKEPSFLREFAVYRIWTFERVWFSELVAYVAEALLSPFSAPFLCRFHACYEEWRIGVGPKKISSFSHRLKREKENARGRGKFPARFMTRWRRGLVWRRFSVCFCVFCWPLLLLLVDERNKGSLVLNSTNQFHILMYTLAVVEIIIRKSPCKGILSK